MAPSLRSVGKAAGAAAERAAILSALHASAGDVRAAARALDVPHTTMWRRIGQLDLRADIDAIRAAAAGTAGSLSSGRVAPGSPARYLLRVPVPIAKVREVQRPLKDRILELLGKHVGSALTVFEIIAPLEELEENWVALHLVAEKNERGKSPTIERYAQALQELVASGQVETAHYHGDDVYFLPGAR